MKKILFFLLAVVLLVCAIDATLDFVYFAGPGKERFQEFLCKKLGTHVEMEKLVFRLLPGFSARNVVIYDCADPTVRQPWLEVEKLDLKPNYLALLAKKKVFKKIVLKHPKLHGVRTRDGQWKFPPIPSSSKRLLVEQLKIRGGVLQLRDEAIGPLAYEQTVSPIDLEAKISLDGNIRLSFRCALADQTESSLTGAGSFSLFTQSFQGSAEATEFPLSTLSPYLDRFLPDLKELSGRMNGQVRFSREVGKPIDFSTDWKCPALNLVFTPWQLQGPVEIKSRGVYSPSENSCQYQGEIALTKSALSSSFIPNPIEDLHGTFSFGKDFLKTNSVEGILDGSSVRGRGALENFSSPRWRASLFGDLPLEKLYPLAKSFLPASLHSLEPQGKCFTQVDFLSDENTGKIGWKGKLYLREGKIEFPWLEKPVTQFQTEIALTPTEIEAPHFSGVCGSQSFTGNVSVAGWNSPRPELSFYFSSPESSLLLNGEWDQKSIQLKKCSGYGYGATFDLGGRLALSAEEPTEASLQAKIDTLALKKAWPALWKSLPWLEAWSPEGPFELDGTWKGAWSRPLDGNADFRLRGKRVSIKKVFFDDFGMACRLSDKKIDFENIKGTIGPGELTGKSWVDLAKNPATYGMEFKARGIPLEQLPQNKKSPEEALLQGLLDGGISMSGACDRPETASGVAYFKVTEGKLGDTPIVKPIWKVVRNVAPSLDKPILQSATADFTIDKGQFITDNMELVGPGIILQPKGKIGLDQKVDFLIQIKFFKPEGSNIKSWAIEGLNLFGKLLELKYHGTLSHPKVDNDWLPVLDKIVSGR